MARRDPPPEFENASWRETFTIMWLVFQTLAVPLAFIVGAMGLVVWFILAVSSNLWAALIPVALGALGIAWFVRRDRQAAAKLIAERDGLSAPGRPRRPGL